MTIKFTKQALERQLADKYNDCCFCDTFTGAAKVNLFRQYFHYRIANHDRPQGKCSSFKIGRDFCCLVGTCSNLQQLPLSTDFPLEKCKRCAFCALGTICCATGVCCPIVGAYVCSEVYAAESQAKKLYPRQFMQ